MLVEQLISSLEPVNLHILFVRYNLGTSGGERDRFLSKQWAPNDSSAVLVKVKNGWLMEQGIMRQGYQLPGWE